MRKMTLVATAVLAAALIAGCNGKKNGGATGKGNGGTGAVRRGVTPPAFPFEPPPYEKGQLRLSPDEIAALFKIARLDPLKARKLSDLRQVLKLPDRMFAEHKGYVLVGLYPAGSRELLNGYSLGGNLAFSVAGATRNALGSSDPEMLATCPVRIDLVHDLKPLDPRNRDESMIPGVDGLACMNKGAVVFMPADRFLADKPDVVKYILELEKLAGLPAGTWRDNKMLLGKYRSLALMQLKPGNDAVQLYRSNVLAGSLSTADCAASARRGMDWLRGVQLENGKFKYRYYPYADRYETEKYHMARHAEAALSLFKAARLGISPPSGTRTGSGSSSGPHFAAGEKALAYIRQLAVKDRAFDFHYVPDGRRVRLGAAAMALVAFCERERAGGDDSNREFMKSLARFILNQQTPRGEFISHYDPTKGRPVNKFISLYYPGEALLGLLRLYSLTGRKDRELLVACHRGAKYLISFENARLVDHINKGGDPAKGYPPDACFMQALEVLIAIDSRPEYVRHLFKLADSMLAWQLSSLEGGRPTGWGGPTRFPDLVGAIDNADPPSAPQTGARCAGLVAALRVARKQGRKDAAARYARALDLAGKFVIQNQFHAHNSYALPQPARAVGGFRLTPLNCTVRMDHVHHCAAFLLEWAALKK